MNPSDSNKKSPLLAICFHFFYQETLSQFTQYIDNVLEAGYPTDIYITYYHETDVMNVVKNKYPNAIFIKSDRGCDTGAFLLQMKYMYKSNKQYDYIFKIHTKKNIQWRTQLLEDIAGSPTIVHNMVELFNNDKDIGMIAVNKWQIDIDKLNKPLIDDMCQSLSIKIKPKQSFVGGTIFWLRYEIVKLFIEKTNVDLDYEYSRCETGYSVNVIPTYTNSWERIYCFLVPHFNYNIKYVPCTSNYIAIRPNHLPINFNWKIYMQLNHHFVKAFIEDNDQYIDHITKILYGLSTVDAIDVTQKVKDIYSDGFGIFNIIDFRVANHLEDPHPGKPKKIMIYRKNYDQPCMIIDEYGGLIDNRSKTYKNAIYLLFNNDSIFDINEKIAINHYITKGQYENRPYDIMPFDWKYYLETNPNLSGQFPNSSQNGDNNAMQCLSHYIKFGKKNNVPIYKKASNLMDKYKIKILAFYHSEYINKKFNLADIYTKATKCSINNIKLPHKDINYDHNDIYETYLTQAHIAISHGIDGFCVDHTWPVNNNKTLESVLLNNALVPINFCFYWTVDKEYNDWNKHFYHLIPHFFNDKYIKIQNKPVFLINIINNVECQKNLLLWNQLAVQWGFDGIFFIQTLNFNSDHIKPIDGYAEWQPNCIFKMMNPENLIDKQTHHTIIYDKICYDIKNTKRISDHYFRGLFTGWNNLLKCDKNYNPIIVENNTPNAVANMVKCLINTIILDPNPIGIDNFIFINSWNNWNEQATLEPDHINGYQTLTLIKEVINKYKLLP